MNIDNAHKMMKAGLRHGLLLLLVMMTGSHAMAQESQGVRIHGSVFGGGNEAGVQTTTQVNICTGQVDGNVYGGGNLGDVGTIDKSDPGYNYVWSDKNGNANSEGNVNNTGVCTVEITGGTIGSSGTVSIDHGNVFGGGKGNDVTYKEGDNTISFYCEKGMVYSTAVNIEDGTVHGNVYGGGQIARVESHTAVTIGDAGATGEGSAPDIKHNVFGAGAGVATHGYSALVRGNPIVTIQGKANVGGNVYGGGEIASVGKHKVKTPANQNDSSTPRDLPMGMPFTLDNTNSGKCTVNIIGGTITGDVFGAGMGVEPAFDENNKPRRMGMGGWEEPFATYAEYLVFVYTLALTTDTYVTIGGTRNADGTVSASGAPIINGSVYGGSENGFVQYHTNVNIIGGQVGTDVYGGGKGFATFPDAGRVSGYAQTTVSGGSVGHDVYGGGKLGLIKGGVNVDMRGGTVGNDVYGGGALANTNTANGLEYIVVPGLTVGESSVVGLYVRTYKQTTDATAQAGKTYYEKKNNTYVVKSMPVGYSVSGLYESEYTEQTSGTAAANTTYYSNTLTTTVNLLSGIISGNAYGGALGDATHEPNVCGDILVELNKNVTTTKGCVVNQVFGCNNANGTPLGKVTVHVYATQHGDESMTTTSAKYNPPYCADQAEEESDKEYLKRLIDAATQSVDENTHEITWITGVDAATLTAAKATYDEGNATAEDLTSAINSVISAFNAMYDVVAVYGGGNEADYTPTDTRQSTEVIIEGCDYTSIKNVYGGGNAAAVPATEVWIVGSKIIDNVFGGGNGERGAEYAAHVGYHRNNDLSTTPYDDGTGQTNVKLIGGKINTVYGGSNLNGDIRGNETDPENPYGSNITMPTLAEYNDTHDPDASTCTLNTKHIYGGGKKANMSSGTNIVLGCMPDGWIDEIYAGAKAADVAGDVSLTITSGKFGRVFGGNKDSGKLEGSITVNIEETGGCDVPIVIGELYGGGNMAGYSIYGYDSNGDPIENEADKTVTTPYADPQVNVRAFTSIGAIYGGGYSALMVGNPTIDINVAKGSHAENDAIHTETEGNVNYFPEGNTETTPSLPYPAHKYGEIGAIGNVYGGGNLANVIGNTAINIGTKTEIPFISTPSHLTKNTETNKYPVSGANITGNVYGGGNAADIIGNTTVTIGTVDLTAKDGTKIGGDVFGGGFGPTTTVTGNVQVNIGAETDDDYVGYATISGNVYGGSAEGKVNATKSGTESITYTVSNGTPTTEVNFYGGTITRDLYGGGYGLDDKEADVYGAVTVNVYKGSTTSTTVTNVFGGNNLSGVTRNTVDVNIAGGTISENVYGGGNAADALGDVTVTVTDGSMVDVFGGGFGQTTVVSGNVEVNIGEKNGNTLSGSGIITGNVYGGSAMGAVNATKDPSTGELTPASNKTTAVKIYAFESLTGSVFGGGLGVDDSDDTNDVIAKNYGNTTVTMEGGTVGTAVYGGANINGTLKAKSTVTITGGTVGTAPAANEAIKDVVFGGGFGQPTLVEGDVEVNIGSEGQTTGGAIIHGSVYGGSALGNVNAYDNNGTLTASTYLDDENETAYRGTKVNLYKGTINGNLYGGGLGRQYAAAVQGVEEVLYTANDPEVINGTKQVGDVKVAGVQAQDPISAVLANVYGPVTVTVKNGEVTDVFGCNNLNGSPQKDVDVIIEGGTIDNVYGGGNLAAYTGNSGTVNSGTVVSMSGGTANYVYGGGLGETAVVNGNTSVTISNGTVNQNVFGGGQQADVTGNVGVTISGGTVTHDVYGGGAFAHTNTGNWNNNTYVQVTTTNGVSLVTGLYTQNGNTYTEIPTPNTRAADGTTYYQKGNWINGKNDATHGTTYKTEVRLLGGIVGNAYGGGLGQMGMAEIQAEVARNYTQEECNAYNATLVGAIAGGTQLSSTQVTAVNEALSTSYTDNQQISEPDANAYNATLQGARTTSDIKPAVAHADAVEPIEANVYGDVSVTVIGTAFTHSFETPKDATGTAIPNALDVPTTGRVFGCNNLNGTPKGNVLVEVHKTRRITDTGEVSDDHQENVFEIHSVYGGGNLATYQPATGKATKVRIYGCKDTSIEKVFGGGNSASVPSTDVLILGTFYVGYAFSGGNGADWYQNGNAWYENNGAPVYGDATIIALGGKIGQLFGGSDTKGTVYGTSTTKLKGQDNFEGEGYETTDCPLQITNAYGAARGADIEGDVNFIVAGCDANDQIERVFGGSYDANIRGGITLTITSGTFAQVFGGNDHGGTIGGEINVNIEETECKPIVIQYLYGGGREAEYPGKGAKYITNEKDGNGDYIGDLVYSVFPNTSAGKNAKINVNVKSATRIDNIYGGSYRAIVNGNTEVNINMMKGNYVGTEITFPDTYRGDQIPNVDSPRGTYEPVVIPDPLPEDGYSVAGLYLMEHDAETDKDIYTRITDQNAVAEEGKTYYRLTQMSGRIQNDIGTIGNVFGGGYEGAVKGNTKINIGTETTVSILKRNESGIIVDEAGNAIYDGNGKLIKGKIVATVDHPALGAHITGNVYGGGENGDITGTTSVYIGTKDGSTIVPVGASGISIAGNVFGGGKGAADNFYCNKAMVGIDGEGAIDENKDGLPDYPDGGTTVIIANGTVGTIENGKLKVGTGNVYGGGQIARVEKNSVVTIGLGEGVATSTPTSAPVIQGDVFGAGRGVNTHGYSALLRGNPTVTIQGNTKVRGSVYGGGEVASVARYNVVNGVPIALQNSWSGKCTVTVQGYAEIGPENNMTMPTFTGNVFGAGKGVLPYEGYTDTQKPSQVLPTGMKYFASKQEVGDGEDDDYFSFIETLALSSQTDVTIGGHAFVKGSVYGGSQNGIVQYDTKVTIQDDCQIGAGQGMTTRHDPSVWAANYTPTDANDLECASWTYGKAIGSSKYAPFDKFANTSGYYDTNNTVSAKGGRPTGDDGHTYYGNIFGGGSGKDPYAPGKWHWEAGIVRGNTQVNITGGHILTSIYGGNELTNVNGNCTVNFGGNATLGVPRTLDQILDHPVTCYLFGGGKGDQRTFFNTWTNVKGTNVTITGGRIYGSVFGGGEDGHVLEDAIVNISGTNTLIGTTGTSYVDGNVFGGGRGFSGDAYTAGNVGGNITMNISGGTMLGSIYGGGRLGSVGYDLTDPEGAEYGVMSSDANRGHVEIEISGGTIGNDNEYVYNPNSSVIDKTTGSLRKTDFEDYTFTVTENNTTTTTTIKRLVHTKGGNVFAGGMGRRMQLDGVTPIETVDWTRLGNVKSTKLTISDDAVIKSNVYGGGEFGEVTGSHTTSDNKQLGTEIIITGGTIGTTIGTGNTAYNFGAVYGGGMGSVYILPASGLSIGEMDTKMGGDVLSNTSVTMSGTGKVYGNVYGGGEIGSVGTATYTKNEPDPKSDGALRNFALSWPYAFTYTANTGLASVNITGNAEVDGYVFGAGKGKVDIRGGETDDIVTHRYDEALIANVRESQVTIGTATGSATATTPTINRSVYGGGEDGHVYEDAKVTIYHGTIARSVFGGGKGESTFRTNLLDPNNEGQQKKDPADNTKLLIEDAHSWTAGRVYKDTEIIMNGGTVGWFIYGGGNLASVGKGNYAGGTDDYSVVGYGELPPMVNETTEGPLWSNTDFTGSGVATITINGGTVGIITDSSYDDDGVPYGSVFGGSRGKPAKSCNFSPRYRYVPDFFLGYTNKNIINIGGKTIDGVTTITEGTAPTIKGSVYGGGQDGHVRNSTEVRIFKGNIDGQGADHDPDGRSGHVFGAGSGIGTYDTGLTDNQGNAIVALNYSSGSVTCTTLIEVYEQAKINGNVYGGGALASVGPPNTGAPNGQGFAEYDNTTVAYPTSQKRPTTTHGSQSYTQVNIKGGEIGGSVYAASRGPSDTFRSWRFDDSNDLTKYDPNKFATDLWSKVIVTGGEIKGNVFGGGETGQVMCGVNVDILGGVIDKDVYGGGAMAHTNINNTNTRNWRVAYEEVSVEEGKSVVGLYTKSNDTYTKITTPSETANANTTYYKAVDTWDWAFDNHGEKYTTNVVLLGGEIKGHAYGGALGQQMREAATGIAALDSVPAKVFGDIKVSLNGLELADYNSNVDKYRSYVTKVDPDNQRSDYMVPSSRTGAIVTRVFGCNNMCGTPIGHVKVHVFATQNANQSDISHKYPKFGDLSEQSVYTITNYGELTTLAGTVGADVTSYTTTLSDNNATEKEKQTALENMIVAIATKKYDVQGVYGGGNLAPYVPKNLSIESAEVIIDGCGFTNIYQVYGGGKAASTPATLLQINGTHEVHEAFGGGNGADNYTVHDKEYTNQGANVGYTNYMYISGGDGTTTPYIWAEKPDATTPADRRANYLYGTGIAETKVAGGYIHRVYGGSNEKGNIQATALSFYEESDDDCPLIVDAAYGQSKNAAIDAEVVMQMSCASGVKEIFGGAKNADVNSNITLNITNGSSLERVFGGNNTSGLINGSITVNVKESGCEPIIISEGLYAGGYLADYSIYGYNDDRSVRTKAQYIALNDDEKAELALKGIPYHSPRINVISATSIANIFGGGYQAKVVGDPHVNVNMTEGMINISKVKVTKVAVTKVTLTRREKTESDVTSLVEHDATNNKDYVYVDNNGTFFAPANVFKEGDTYSVYKDNDNNSYLSANENNFVDGGTTYVYADGRHNSYKSANANKFDDGGTTYVYADGGKNTYASTDVDEKAVEVTKQVADNPDDPYAFQEQEGGTWYVYKDAEGIFYDQAKVYTNTSDNKTYAKLGKFFKNIALGSIGNIYGGGNLADIDGDTYVEIGTGEWLNDYWQRETQSSDGHTYTYDNDTKKWSYTVTEGETTTSTPYSGNGNPTPTRNKATITGNVFGGGKGVADDFFCRKAMVGAEGSGAIDADGDGELDSEGGTNVTIANGTVGTIENGKLKVGTGNVYGGGEIARVEKNTMVTIGIEGDETNAPTNEPIILGDVFGAGSGVETHGYSALVRGNPTVIVQGNAKVRGSVYGGGEIASVARYKVVNGSPVALANNWSGNCIVTIRGNAEIGPVEPMLMKKAGGPDDTGHVFGAGKGVLPGVYSYEGNANRPRRMLAKTTPLSSNNSTSVDIDDNNKWEYFGNDEDYHAFIESLALSSQTNVTIGGNAFVKGSVYGGSLSGIVQYDTHVTIQDHCQIGAGEGVVDGNGHPMRYDEELFIDPTTTEVTTANALAECAHWDYVSTESAPYDPYAVEVNGTYVYDYTNYSTSIPEEQRRASSDGGKPMATDGHTYYGNVFGGGSGIIPYGPGLWHREAGAVRGNTYVDITGGHILTNVYGGNEHTDVGTYVKDHLVNTTTPISGGKCTINITGGTLGVPRTLAQIAAHPVTCYLFGAGKGDQRIFFNTWTNVINTEVNITGNARIYGSTFGGGEDGHIIYNAVTNIGGTVKIDLNGDGDTTDNGETFTENGMIIGTTGTSYVDGNVFGGGRGFSGEAQTAGTVGGNVTVNIENGKILGSVYGGGRLASVGTQFTAPNDDNYGNFLEDSEPTLYTQAECNAYNATLEGAKAAGGEITAEEANTYNATLEGAKTTNDIKNYNVYGHVTINISGGTIGNTTLTGSEPGEKHSGNVFGSSMGRLTLLNGKTNPIWPKMAQVKTTAVNIYDKAVIRRNVYGGSELGTVRDNASVVIGGKLNQTVTDGCNAEDFKLNPTAADSTFTVSTHTDSNTHLDYPIVGRDVYGGGYGSDDHHTHTIFTVKEPDENNEFQNNTYAFTPMQFAGGVGQNTFVNILGGYVRKSIYGGGELASVGIINCRVDSILKTTTNVNEIIADKVIVNENTNYYYFYKNYHKHSDANNGFALSWPYHFEFVPTFEGATHINITGGRIGLKESTDTNNFEENNKDNGDVYGGGKGIAGNYEEYVFCANVGTTEVNIDYSNDENKTLNPAAYNDSGDCIAGAVYGGAENGHVLADTHVTLTDGLIGHSLYGGGSGKGQFTKWLTMIPEDNRKPITNTGSGTPPNKDGDQYEATCYSITAGKVFGNTYVTMKDGYVVRNIYGGGTLGSVGKGSYAGGTDDFSYYVSSPTKTYNGYGEALQGSLWDNTTDNATTNKFSTAFLNSGKCSVTVLGGTVGHITSNPSESIKDGLPYGNVFGGCRGASAPNIGESPRYLYSPEFFLGYVNETEVTIGTNGATTGPKILGSVYGGGQDGHVRRDTHVTINSGEIGLAYDQETTAKTNVTKLGTADLDNIQWMARGNVYGAGSGISEYKYDFNYDGDYDDVVTYINPQTGRPSTMKETDTSTSAGSVTRFTQVDIVGGIIHRNVYGGGSLASVGPPKIPPTRPDDGDSPRDVSQDRPGHQTLNLVNITGTVGTPDGYAPDTYSGDDSFKYNKVYGGEVYGASRGTDPDNTSLATSVWTEVNLLPGAHVLNNVFGGGDNGMVKQDAVVNVGLPVNITPTSLSFTQKAPINEESNSKTITVGFDAPWTAESSANWLTVTPSGTGGTITVTAADNLPAIGDNTAEERTATITIKGVFGQRTVTVSQAGGGN